MRLIGLMLARDESWVLGASIDAALRWVDELVFLHHGPIDHKTFGILKRHERIHVSTWDEGEHWREMDARQRSLEEARKLGATHCAIIDSDEMLTHNLLSGVRGYFDCLKPGECLDLPMLAPWKSLEEYSVGTTAQLTLGFADAPNLCWKPRGEEKYHHHSRPPQGSRAGVLPAVDGGVMHLQFANWDRFIQKHRHYMMTELVRWSYPAKDINEKYTWWTHPPHGMVLRKTPDHWWGDYRKSDITLGGDSWYVAACRNLVKKHGKDRFKNLDLLGWVP